jgi:hypothetical protein
LRDVILLERIDMRVSALFVAIALLALPAGRPATADGLEVQPVIGDNPMRCYDYRGAAVWTLMTADLGDVGRASIIGRMPVISLDSDRMRSLPGKMQVFFYMHECAHHVLGHMRRPTLESEREADCWAVNYGRWIGLLTRKDIEAFAPYLVRSNGSKFGHLPGRERLAYLLTCFDKPESEPVISMFRNDDTARSQR